MPNNNNDNIDEKDLPLDNERREALVKLGKYAAYTAPAMLVTTNAKRAFAAAAPGTQVTTTTATPTTTTAGPTTTTTAGPTTTTTAAPTTTSTTTTAAPTTTSTTTTTTTTTPAPGPEG